MSSLRSENWNILEDITRSKTDQFDKQELAPLPLMKTILLYRYSINLHGRIFMSRMHIRYCTVVDIDCTEPFPDSGGHQD